MSLLGRLDVSSPRTPAVERVTLDPDRRGEPLHPHRPAGVGADPLCRLPGLGQAVVAAADLAQRPAHRHSAQPVAQLALDLPGEDREASGCVQQPQRPFQRFRDAVVDHCNHDGLGRPVGRQLPSGATAS